MDKPVYKKSLIKRILEDAKQNYVVYLMLLPVLAYFIVFCYMPMGGLVMAFQNYKIKLGFMNSKWVGFDNFTRFFDSIYFGRLLKNTLMIGVKDILYTIPMTVAFALMLNAVMNKPYKRIVQTITYLPYFISMIVVCGLIKDFTEAGSSISNFVGFFTGRSESLLNSPASFQEVFVLSGVWQGLGYGAVVYISALDAIDESLYEAARIDGANNWQQTWHVTLPGIASTIVIMLILKVGQIMSVNYQKLILLYSPATYEVGDVITSYVYRISLSEGSDYSYGAAIGLFNSVVSLVLVYVTNTISRKFSETSLW